MILLETERMFLRQFRESDLDDYARICADAEMMKYIGEGKTLTRAEAWRSIAFILGHWHLRGYGLWAAEEKATGQFLGRVGLYYPEGWPELEVGWSIDRRRWGEGFATEGGRAAIRWAFDNLGLARICSLIQPGNAASIRVAEKLGETLWREDQIAEQRVLIYAVERGPFEAADS